MISKAAAPAILAAALLPAVLTNAAAPAILAKALLPAVLTNAAAPAILALPLSPAVLTNAAAFAARALDVAVGSGYWRFRGVGLEKGGAGAARHGGRGSGCSWHGGRCHKVAVRGRSWRGGGLQIRELLLLGRHGS